MCGGVECGGVVGSVVVEMSIGMFSPSIMGRFLQFWDVFSVFGGAGVGDGMFSPLNWDLYTTLWDLFTIMGLFHHLGSDVT